MRINLPLRKLYFCGECPKSGGGFKPPRSGWKPLPLCAAKLREGHTSKVPPKGDKFTVDLDGFRLMRSQMRDTFI